MIDIFPFHDVLLIPAMFILLEILVNVSSQFPPSSTEPLVPAGSVRRPSQKFSDLRVDTDTMGRKHNAISK